MVHRRFGKDQICPNLKDLLAWTRCLIDVFRQDQMSCKGKKTKTSHNTNSWCLLRTYSVPEKLARDLLVAVTEKLARKLTTGMLAKLSNKLPAGMSVKLTKWCALLDLLNTSGRTSASWWGSYSLETQHKTKRRTPEPRRKALSSSSVSPGPSICKV